jgi:hypothetical protein
VDKGSNIFSVTAGLLNASGDLYEDGDDSFLALLIMPSFAHFVARNFSVGGDILLFNAKQGEEGLSLLGIGPKAMYFFGGDKAKSYPYLTSGFYYVRQGTDSGGDEDTYSGTRLKIGGGMSVMTSSHLGLLVEASYNLDNLKPEKGESKSGNMIIVSMGLAGFSF